MTFKGFVAHCGCHVWFKPNIKYEGQMAQLVFRERATNDEGYRALPSRTAKPHTQRPSSLLFPYFSNLNTSNTTDLTSDKIKLLTLAHYCEVYCFKIYLRVKYRRWDIHESMKVWWYINGNSIGNKMSFFEGKSPLWCTASAHKMNRPVYQEANWDHFRILIFRSPIYGSSKYCCHFVVLDLWYIREIDPIVKFLYVSVTRGVEIFYINYIVWFLIIVWKHVKNSSNFRQKGFIGHLGNFRLYLSQGLELVEA